MPEKRLVYFAAECWYTFVGIITMYLVYEIYKFSSKILC